MSTIIDLGKIRFQFRGDYSATEQYEYNDVVKYGGDVYVFINATSAVGTAPTTTTHWSSMVSGLKARGAWSSSETYQTNHVVTHGGNTYRAIIATTNHVPPNATYWELLAAATTSRATGPQQPLTRRMTRSFIWGRPIEPLLISPQHRLCLQT